MSDPFALALADIFAGPQCVDATVAQGASSWTRRVLLSRDVESVDLTSGGSSRVTTVQFPRIGGLGRGFTVTIGTQVYRAISRVADDGYAETWTVTQ